MNGITINGKHSFNDFDVCIAERDIGTPEKKSIFKTVPFFNGFYDFSSLDGYPAWGSRSVKYVFDVIGDTIAETERLKSELMTWLCNVENAEIYDDDIPDFHFKGSYSSDSVEEDESGLKMTVTVIYTCYPFLIADNVKTVSLPPTGIHTIINAWQPVGVEAVTTNAVTVTVNGKSVSLPANSTVKLGIMLKHGANTITTTAPVTLKWREERK